METSPCSPTFDLNLSFFADVSSKPFFLCGRFILTSPSVPTFDFDLSLCVYAFMSPLKVSDKTNRYMEVLLDERPIFKGEIQKAPGFFFWVTRFLNLKNTPFLLTTTQPKNKLSFVWFNISRKAS